MYADQEKFGRQYASRPERSSFASSAGGRFVLRADHYCVWADSWIGFQNHRYFILLTFWATLYCLSWFIFRYRWIFLIFNPFHFNQLITLILSPFMFYIMGFAFHHFYKSFKNLSKNTTIIEIHHKKNTEEYNKGCYNNFSEICGEKILIPFWIFPCFCLSQPIDGFYNGDL